jgi:hypothetical protein
MKYDIYITGSSWGGSATSCKSLKDCKKLFERTANEIGKHADRASAVGVVSAQDCAFLRFTIGPRGGIRKERC